MMKSVRFALCSDLHHDFIPDAEHRLDDFLAHAEKEQVDFIIQLGDFCYANECNRWVANRWSTFACPSYHVLGNHDMDHCTKAQAVEFLGMPAPYYSFEAGELHCIVIDPNHLLLDGAYADYSFGNYFAHPDKINWLGTDQLAWIENDLSHTDKKTILFSHQSLADPVFGARDAEALHQILQKENARCGFQKVIACLNGHDHTDGVRFVQGIYFISINSASFFYMSKNICVPRYSLEITNRYPILRQAAPYKEALYTVVTVSEDAIHLSAKETSYVGPSPCDCGHCGHAGGHPASPGIRPKKLLLAR